MKIRPMSKIEELWAEFFNRAKEILIYVKRESQIVPRVLFL